MKYGMPRKIDDERRKKLFLTGLVLLAMAMAALFGYETWMHPYRLRRERLASVLSEGEKFLSRFDESLASANPAGLNAARNRLAVLSSEAKERATELPNFSLDVELYAPADRMTAERLLAEHAATVAEYAKESAASRAAAAKAAGLAEDIGRLLEESSDESAAEARSDLAQSLVELKAVHSQIRPSVDAAAAAEERFNASQSKAVDARARIAEWTEDALKAMADAESIESEMTTAKQRMTDAANRVRALREEGLSLPIEQNSAKLASLQSGLQKGESDLAKALDSYRAAKRAADAALGDIQKQAREKCQTDRDAIRRLSSEHGSLLPEDKVQAGTKAADELEAAIREHNEIWKKLGERGSELIRQAETLRSEAGGIIAQLENARQTGAVGIDAVRASALSGEMAAIRGELVAAETGVGTDGLKRQLDAIVARAKASMLAVQAAKPDVPKLLSGIREEAKAALKEIARAQSEKDMLEIYIRDGRGSAKTALQQALSLSECRHPDTAESELRRLSGANASTGRDILGLRERLSMAMDGVQKFANAVEKVRKDQEAAETAGRFFPVSWEEGAIGWAPGMDVVVMERDENVLVPVYSGEESPCYTWEFDFRFASAGQHRIDVKVSKPEIGPVNEKIDRLKKVVHDGQSVNGGWIGVECQLSSSSGTWRDELWIPNYNRLSSPETVVSGNGVFGANNQTFTLQLTLHARPVPENNKGWHSSRLLFTVFVDGKQIQQFWHKAR